jgi:hypothetical protein
MIEQILFWEAVQLTLAAMIHAMHDPLHIFRAAEILRQAIVFAGMTALLSAIISSVSVIVVTHSFTRYLKSIAKPAILLMACLMPLGLSGCGGGESEDCYWWHRHRHPHHWRAEDGKSETSALQPVKLASMPTTDEPAKPEIVAKPGPFGGITVMNELRDLKRHVTDLANRPVVCLCECGRRPFRDTTKGPGPVMFWRVDPMNPSIIQYGYEVGGFFYVLSSSPRPVGFEPPK